MVQTIQTVINEWSKQKGSYYFETRINPPLFPTQIPTTTPIVDVSFIIDVEGFFYDEKKTKQIKLNFHKDLQIDRFNTSKEYADNLRKELQLLTEEAYSTFEEVLSSLPQPVYTSDPWHMK